MEIKRLKREEDSYVRTGQPIKAMECDNKILRLAPDDVDTVVHKGHLLMRSNVPQALQYFERALK